MISFNMIEILWILDLIFDDIIYEIKDMICRRYWILYLEILYII